MGEEEPGATVESAGSADPIRSLAGDRFRPRTGRISHVTGRGSDDTRGLPPVQTVALVQDDGTDLIFGPIRHDDAVQVHVQALGVPAFRDFGFCPICGSTHDLTREHIPQHDLGGRVMTLTCQRCNNLLGTKVEPALRDWFDDAIGSVRFSGGDVRGRRRASRILLRGTPTGEFGLFVDAGKNDADISRMFASGEATMEYRVPPAPVWRMAALKHAYLAACLTLGEVPQTPNARQIRVDLTAARDHQRGTAFPVSKIAGGLRVFQSHQPAQGPTIILAALTDQDLAMHDGGVSLAGTLFVSWPLEAHLYWEAARRLQAEGDADNSGGI